MTSNFHGGFVWYELMTTDTDAAKAFYGAVIGWSTRGFDPSGTGYDVLIASTGKDVGGIMPLPAGAAEAGLRPGWVGYVGVDDVDAMAARIAEAGGAIHKRPWDIPSVGRLAMVADPQGAAFMLIKGSHEGAPEAFKPGAAGHAGWNELQAADWQSAFAFYARLFGWQRAEAVDIGPMGTYQLFSAGAEPIGGMMTKAESVATPSWRTYFNVEAIDAAARRTSEKGGTVLHGPTEVPGGDWIVQCVDPQGAAFALTARRR